MITIERIRAYEILDSRGNPTIEAECFLNSGVVGRAKVPSGASVGKHEALELRDNDKNRYFGKGVLKAARNINEIIAPALTNMNASDQKAVDQRMIDLDGTENKSKLGANAILGVSIAVARAVSYDLGIPLYRHIGGLTADRIPIPMLNVINGGVHAGWNLDFQEYHIIPAKFETFREAIRAGSEIYHQLGSDLMSLGFSAHIADEGGYAPTFDDNLKPIEVIMKAIEHTNYKPADNIFLSLDIAASEFYQNNQYFLRKGNVKFSSKELVDYYEKLINDYPIISIEDGLAEDDWEGWQELTQRLGDKIQIVGDDIFVTNINRLKKGIDLGVGNALIIKPNQVGTVSECLECIRFAKLNKYSIIISHRSGETSDSFIADLAVAGNAEWIKTGAPARSDRVTKYNQLLKIEEESRGAFAGKAKFK